MKILMAPQGCFHRTFNLPFIPSTLLYEALSKIQVTGTRSYMAVKTNFRLPERERALKLKKMYV